MEQTMQANILSSELSHKSKYLTHTSASWSVVMAGIVGLDALALLAAFALAYVIRFKSTLPVFQDGAGAVDFYTWVIVWALPVWLSIFGAWRLYDRRTLFSGYGEYARIGSACTAGALAIVLISFLYDTPNIARAWLVLVWVGSVAFLWGTRFLIRRSIRWARSHGQLLTPTLVIGTNGEGASLVEQLTSDPSSGVRVLGLVEGSVPTGLEAIRGVPVVGGLADVDNLQRVGDIEQIVIATGAVDRDDLLDLYWRFAHRADVDLRMSSGLFEVLATGVRVQHAGAVPLMALDRIRITGVDAALKTMFDISIALGALVVLSPMLLLLALVVRLDAGGPVIYRRRVVGRSGRPFDAFKFRTMIQDRRASSLPTTFPDRRQVDKSRADPRVTRIGHFLRRSSLDELPQLFNVLRGEMSVIGPRMVSPDEIERYGKLQLNLLTVKPGITGPWQVRGRSDIEYNERVRLSTEYIRNYSIWLDLQILLQTVPIVLRGKGAY
jgi:exopolysaccharide biosynthesis polyprenyl glycosylphosphotransferase